MSIIQKIIDLWQFRKLYRTDVGKKVATIVQKFMHGRGLLATTTKEFKNERIKEIFSLLNTIESSENPFMSFRKALSDQIVSYAYFAVLTMSKEDPPASESAYISGELRKHIKELSKHNELVKMVVWDTGENWADNDIIDMCNLRKDVHLFCIYILDVYREEMKDIGQNKDWLKPFLKCMCIWQEDQYREMINLPSLLPNTMDSLKYSTFMNRVINGIQNPLYDFEQKYPELKI